MQVNSICVLAVTGNPSTLIVSAPASGAADYPIKDVPLTAVKFVGGFWGARQATDVAVTIAHEIKQCELTNRIKNFELAAAALKGAKDGRFATSYAFDDSDVYKVIEAASYALQLKPDPALTAKLDDLRHAEAWRKRSDAVGH